MQDQVDIVDRKNNTNKRKTTVTSFMAINGNCTSLPSKDLTMI